jgi:hypothetical protein
MLRLPFAKALRVKSGDHKATELPAGWNVGARSLNPHPLQKRKTQRVRHPQNRSEVRLRAGVGR